MSSPFFFCASQQTYTDFAVRFETLLQYLEDEIDLSYAMNCHEHLHASGQLSVGFTLNVFIQICHNLFLK